MYFVRSDVISFISNTGDIQFGTSSNGAPIIKFKDGNKKCIGLAEAYEQLCLEEKCDFIDAGKITSSSLVDGVHFDLDQHHNFANAITKPILNLI